MTESDQSPVGYIDQLTGFLDHRELIAREGDRIWLDGAVVLVLDLVNFRRINHAFDRATGDRVLRAIARRIESSADVDAILARIGGDEFAIVLPLGGEHLAHQLAERLVERIAEPVRLTSRTISLAVSIGIAVIQPGERLASALRRADVALAYAHDDDRTPHIRQYVPEMSRHATHRVVMEDELRQALMEQQFRLYYQPLVDLKTHVPFEVEALLRWEHPERGVLTPDEFLAEAEAAGLMGRLGRWVLHEACRQGRVWQETLGNERRIVVAVNLAPSQFRDPRMASDIVDILADTGFDPSLLRLEISESIMPDDIEPAIRLMQQVQPLGIQVALDDFGAGYAGWSFLKHCPIDAIKIDRSLLTSSCEKRGSRWSMVEAMVAFADRLRVPVSIEGIEHAEEAHAMRALGISTGQGFFFAHPQPADQVAPKLANGPIVPMA